MKNVSILSVLLLMTFLPFISFAQCPAWPQLGINLDGDAVLDRFGISVSLSGNGKRMAAGADMNDASGMNAGQVRVFEWDGTTWVQMGSDLEGTSIDERFGGSVSLNNDGSVLAVGAPQGTFPPPGPGVARIYDWNGTAWIQRGANILGQVIGDNCGSSIRLNAAGDRVVIGSGNSDGGGTGFFTGHVRVFQWSGTAWVQLGLDINGDGGGDATGYNVDLDAAGTTVVIGSAGNDNAVGSNAGLVRVFEWNGTAWVQKGSDLLGLNGGENFGSDFAISANGNVLAAGAKHNTTSAQEGGQIRVFDWSGTTWVQRGIGVNGEGASSFFGSSLDLSADGNTFAGGEPSIDGGDARIFTWDGSAWVFEQKFAAENLGDLFGSAVSLSGDGSTIAIGGYRNSDNGNGAGHVRVFANGSVNLAIKTFLQGALDSGTGLMNDDLRAAGLLPTTDPYGLGKMITMPSVLMTIGNNAIVDWVQVELRDQTDPAKIIKSTAALLQRDGDIVDVDGVSTIKFCGLNGGDYFVAVRHRNHLGVLSNTPVTAQ